MYGAFPVCRNYTVRAHIRDVIAEKRRGRANTFRNAGSLQRRVHAQHLRSLDTRYETERGGRNWKHHPQRDLTPKPKRRLQLAAAVQSFKIFLKTEKLMLFYLINLDKSTAFSPVWVKSGSGRMTKEMRLIFEKGKWNDKRDTPAAAPPPRRLHFLMFSALHAEKAALLRRKNAFGRTTALLAPRMPSQNKKVIPYGMTFCFGGDKRDRTADLGPVKIYAQIYLQAPAE